MSLETGNKIICIIITTLVHATGMPYKLYGKDRLPVYDILFDITIQCKYYKLYFYY